MNTSILLLLFIKITIMIQWEKALKWEEESFSLLPSLPCFPLITTNNPLLSTLCVCVLGSPVVRPSGLGPGVKLLQLSPQGYLSKDSIDIACKLPISFGSYETIEDEQDHLNSLRQANALFTYAQRTLCTCAQCAQCFTQKQ